VPVPEPKPDPDPDPPEEKKDFDLQIETPNDRGKSKMQIVAELLREGGSENEMVTRLNQSHPKSPEANRRDIQKYAKFLEYMGLIDTDIKTTYKVR